MLIERINQLKEELGIDDSEEIEPYARDYGEEDEGGEVRVLEDFDF